MRKIYRSYRHPVLLLEVLIAFALVALCALPLIYPHVFILRSEKKFISAVELDHVVNLLFAQLLQKLYQKEIAWGDIENGKEILIESSLLKSVGYKDHLPFLGSYKFVKIRKKPPKEADHSAYLFNLEFTFIPEKGFFLENKPKEEQSKFVYKYQVPVERYIK